MSYVLDFLGVERRTLIEITEITNFETPSTYKIGEMDFALNTNLVRNHIAKNGKKDLVIVLNRLIAKVCKISTEVAVDQQQSASATQS